MNNPQKISSAPKIVAAPSSAPDIRYGMVIAGSLALAVVACDPSAAWHTICSVLSAPSAT